MVKISLNSEMTRVYDEANLNWFQFWIETSGRKSINRFFMFFAIFHYLQKIGKRVEPKKIIRIHMKAREFE